MQSGVSSAQAVVARGKVYIGGGGVEGSEFKILEHRIQGGQWREIETPVSRFGMAVVHNKLLIIGGKDKVGRLTNQLWAQGSVPGNWTQPYPAMHVASRFLSAVGYKRWVLVVGGDGGKCVEVLDTATKKWYMATPLPDDASRPTLTAIQDTLYVVWGCSAVSLSIPSLISDAVSQHPTTHTSSGPQSTEWQQLPDTLTKDPAITSLLGSLVAVGGRFASSCIAMYLPSMNQWVEVARLPIPRQRCTCAILPWSQQLMVIGGRNKNAKFVKTIDLCTLAVAEIDDMSG